MASLRPHRLSQIGLGVLLLIIIRTLGEFFRLQYVKGDALTIAQAEPYVGSALFTAAGPGRGAGLSCSRAATAS